MALMTHSRMATPTQWIESSSSPMSRLTWPPTTSTKSTISNVLVNSSRMLKGCLETIGCEWNTIPSVKGCQVEYRKISAMSSVRTATVTPARRLQGRIRVPGDKSISHRYALLAALSRGRSELRNYAPGADCRSTLSCLAALGVDVAAAGDTITLMGRGLLSFRSPAGALDAGNSGPTMRMLTWGLR